MSRQVVVTFDTNALAGAETFELWLKAGAAAWILYATGAVDQISGSQDFTLEALTAGVTYRVQARMVRGGRYRTDYTSVDPTFWPLASLITFVAGEDSGIAAPSLDAVAWERTSAIAQQVTVTATSSLGNDALALQLLRGGVVVAEVAGPHVGAVSLIDVNPPIGTTQSYTVRHTDGVNVGTQSAPTTRYTGPNAPTGLADTTAVPWYAYDLAWDTPPAGAVTRVQDDYASVLVFVDRDTPTAANATTFATTSLQKASAMAPNGNIMCYLQARARHEVTAFGVTDVSPWAGPIEVLTEIAPDETEWDSRPAP